MNELIKLEHVNKIYKDKYALNDINLSFNSNGLVCILGKSGSGKSTLLNMIGLLDKPTNGKVIINNKNVNKWNEDKKSKYRNVTLGFIFQHYHLFEDQTSLFNVMLPSLIKGDKYKESKNKAISLLQEFNINECLYNQKVSNLSGGEKERIAILRSFINNPLIILADEPTGALDSYNSTLVMQKLKKEAKDKLIIVVTHNQQLADKYADRIITIDQGKITKDIINNKNNIEGKIKTRKTKPSNFTYIDRLIQSNFKKRLKRNIISILSLIVGLVSSLIIIGFSNGAPDSINKASKRQFDYGNITISKEVSYLINDSPVNIIQTSRPKESEINELRYTYNNFNYYQNYDGLFASGVSFYINDSIIEGLTYSPIYSFIDNSINKDLLIEGKLPLIDSLNQVVINKQAYNFLKGKLKYSPLNAFINLKVNTCVNYYTNETSKPYISDYFVLDKIIQIVGVVDELSFLSFPKIYYSYKSFDEYIDQIYLNNLSEYFGINYSWKDRILMCENNEPLSSYSYRGFLKDVNEDSGLINIYKDSLDLSINVTSLTIKEALESLINAATMGMGIFLTIAIIGTSLILGIISFSSYCEDKKRCAILLCLGAKKDDVTSIYIFESLLIGLIALTLSIILAYILVFPLNILIENIVSLSNLINIPFVTFLNKRFLLLIIILLGTIFVCIISTYFPIAFSKKISLKEELKEE